MDEKSIAATLTNAAATLYLAEQQRIHHEFADLNTPQMEVTLNQCVNQILLTWVGMIQKVYDLKQSTDEMNKESPFK